MCVRLNISLLFPVTKRESRLMVIRLLSIIGNPDWWKSRLWCNMRSRLMVIRHYSICFQTSFWFTRIYLCFKIIRNYSRFYEMSPSCFLFCLKRSRFKIVLDPPKTCFANLVSHTPHNWTIRICKMLSKDDVFFKLGLDFSCILI